VFTYLLIDEAHAFQVYGEKNEEGYFQSTITAPSF
jgi:7-keto-8-aminopelargonate synthetase-like enzyme